MRNADQEKKFESPIFTIVRRSRSFASPRGAPPFLRQATLPVFLRARQKATSSEWEFRNPPSLENPAADANRLVSVAPWSYGSAADQKTGRLICSFVVQRKSNLPSQHCGFERRRTSLPLLTAVACSRGKKSRVARGLAAPAFSAGPALVRTTTFTAFAAQFGVRSLLPLQHNTSSGKPEPLQRRCNRLSSSSTER